MTIKKLEHVGVVVHDLDAARAFFAVPRPPDGHGEELVRREA